ncbi:MAG: hypothetical protein IT424_06345 [Pirellulales bacterium]|nr:hypothetical protein [Pirellulales bacterium]
MIITRMLVATLGVAVAQVAVGQVVAINFDQTAAGTPLVAPGLFTNAEPLTTEYSSLGLVVSGPAAGSGAAILDQISNFGVAARSGRNFLAVNDFASLSGGGVSSDPVIFDFAPPIRSLTLFISGGAQSAHFRLEGFDAAMQSLGSINAMSSIGAYAPVSYMPASIVSRVQIESLDDPDFVIDDMFFQIAPEPNGCVLAMAALLALRAGVGGLARRRPPREAG